MAFIKIVHYQFLYYICISYSQISQLLETFYGFSSHSRSYLPPPNIQPLSTSSSVSAGPLLSPTMFSPHAKVYFFRSLSEQTCTYFSKRFHLKICHLNSQGHFLVLAQLLIPLPARLYVGLYIGLVLLTSFSSSIFSSLSPFPQVCKGT